MQVFNPTDTPITVSIKGNEYSVGANASISGVKESHAEYWKGMLHQFIEVTPEVTKKAPDVAKVVKEIIADVPVKEVVKK